MSDNQVTVQAMQNNSLTVAAFVLSIMGMYASPILSSVLALISMRQVKSRGQQGFASGVDALAVSVAVTALARRDVDRVRASELRTGDHRELVKTTAEE
ncbi:hypothetical protein [Mycobacterium tilburgii]|uniref:hypothetical protein n=1 Tax=Mycobacterium tilburgii TaxID=44467 RepID=UPI0011837464|nr:hypothetical protein [Mycobacterium tilburgii]